MPNSHQPAFRLVLAVTYVHNDRPSTKPVRHLEQRERDKSPSSAHDSEWKHSIQILIATLSFKVKYCKKQHDNFFLLKIKCEILQHPTTNYFVIHRRQRKALVNNDKGQAKQATSTAPSFPTQGRRITTTSCRGQTASN